MSAHPLQILLVEDNAADVRLTSEAICDRAGLELRVAGDGDEAITYLKRACEVDGGRLPDLLLLDLNLPRKSGSEVLATIKADPDLRHVPLIVLSTSQAETDVLAAYKLGANAYIVKSADFDQFRKVVNILDSFWFGVARLPCRETGRRSDTSSSLEHPHGDDP